MTPSKQVHSIFAAIKQEILELDFGLLAVMHPHEQRLQLVVQGVFEGSAKVAGTND